MDWAETSNGAKEADDRINARYRMRIDAPMTGAELEGMRDHFPEGWAKD